MFDLDHFKRINDTYSHEAGDAVLVAFATLLSELAKEPVVAARLGGEEFLVILPGVDRPQARHWTTQALARIRAHDWSPVAGDLPVTVSVGLYTAKGAGWSRERLLQTADHNLYAAKRGGRDRFVGP
jgi:diguanylate cyclase (GGDEF)-like protein